MKHELTPQPRSQPSDEANAQQIALARLQGKALDDALREMTEHEAHGREMRAGDYMVALAAENAEGLYVMRDGALVWCEPGDENAHIEVSVRDAVDGRFVPGLDIHVTVHDPGGRELGTHRHPFLWHPWLYHYGRNWTLPRNGSYTIRVHVSRPDFPRHDKVNGRRFTEPVDVEFAEFEITTGQKRS